MFRPDTKSSGSNSCVSPRRLQLLRVSPKQTQETCQQHARRHSAKRALVRDRRRGGGGAVTDTPQCGTHLRYRGSDRLSCLRRERSELGGRTRHSSKHSLRPLFKASWKDGMSSSRVSDIQSRMSCTRTGSMVPRVWPTLTPQFGCSTPFHTASHRPPRKAEQGDSNRLYNGSEGMVTGRVWRPSERQTNNARQTDEKWAGFVPDEGIW